MSWKPLFYEGLLPALRLLGPARADAVLGWLGQLTSWAWPPRRHELEQALARARTAYELSSSPRTSCALLAASTLRFLARDCPLDHAAEAAFFARFDVKGFEHVNQVLAQTNGVILLGNHVGGYLAGIHWLYRRGLPLRLLVQRPQHVSKFLRSRFDRRDGPYPQPDLFLRRGLAPDAAAERMLRALAALRDGMAVYLTGDIPWTSPNARPGRLLGQSHTFLSVWADLAAVTRVPVVPLFCTHRPGGRYALTFDAPLTLAPGDEAEAVTQFLERLDAEIAVRPTEAVAHLLWPCYRTSTDSVPSIHESNSISADKLLST
jgi:lauroyl/myristoyl acyltransferase